MSSCAGRPISPLVLGRVLEPKPKSRSAVLEETINQRQQYDLSGQHGLCSSSSRSPSPTKSPAYPGINSGSLMAAAAAGMPGMHSACSVGELSLWGEPLNVRPVSPPRSQGTAAAAPAAMLSHTGMFSQDDQQEGRPASPCVLSTFATDHNIAPAVVTGPDQLFCSGSPLNVALQCSTAGEPAGCSCRSRSCSPTAYRSASSPSPAGRSRSCSPSHLVCCGCRRQHPLRQHSRCCHLCTSCCKSRATCKAGSGSMLSPSAGVSAGSSGPVVSGFDVQAGEAVAAGSCAGGGGGELNSEPTCPCIKAYRQGHRDAMQQAHMASVGPGHTAAAAADSTSQSSTGAACGSALALTPGRHQQQGWQQVQQQQQEQPKHPLPGQTSEAVHEKTGGAVTPKPAQTCLKGGVLTGSSLAAVAESAAEPPPDMQAVVAAESAATPAQPEQDLVELVSV